MGLRDHWSVRNWKSVLC